MRAGLEPGQDGRAASGDGVGSTIITRPQASSVPAARQPSVTASVPSALTLMAGMTGAMRSSSPVTTSAKPGARPIPPPSTVPARIGGQAARQRDETWPLDCGCVGQETTGAGGLAKALRTVPIVLDLAERARRRASPSAFIIDFTNPVGIVTRALLSAGHRAVGLCNVAIGFQRDFASLLGVSPDRVSLGHVGLNHLTRERSVSVDGVDVLPELLDKHADEIAPHTGMAADFIRHLGMVPSYYLRYYYAHDTVVESLRGTVTRAEEVARLETELLELYADPALDTKPPQLAQRGGAWYSEAAVDLLVSLTSDRRDVQVVNTGNGGTLPFLPADAVIEVPAVVGRDGDLTGLTVRLPAADRGRRRPLLRA